MQTANASSDETIKIESLLLKQGIKNKNVKRQDPNTIVLWADDSVKN